MRPFPGAVILRGLLVALACAAVPGASSAQFLDPDHCFTCADKARHVAAGAAVNLLVRGPWIAPTWRDRPWKRVLLGCGIGAVYELFQAAEAQFADRKGSGYGFSPLDLGATCLGGALVEFIL